MKESNVSEIINAVCDSIKLILNDLGNDAKNSRWKLGKITNYLKRKARQNGMCVTDIYKAVSIMTNHEYAPRSIERFAAIKEFFPQAVINEFEELPYSHFAFAMQCGHLWRHVLELSRERCAIVGKLPSVAWLEMALKDGYGKGCLLATEAECTAESNADEIVAEWGGADRNDNINRPAAWRVVWSFKVTLTDAINMFKHQESLPLSADMKAELERRLDEIIRLLDVALAELDHTKRVVVE